MLAKCILISDQTFVPIHLGLQVHPSKDAVNWLQCRLGEKGCRGMLRRAYGAGDSGLKRLSSLEEDADSIAWAYRVTYGAKT